VADVFTGSSGMPSNADVAKMLSEIEINVSSNPYFLK